MTKYEEMQREMQYAKQRRKAIEAILASSYQVTLSVPGRDFSQQAVSFPCEGEHAEALRVVLTAYDTHLADEIAKAEAKLAAVEELLKE